MRSVVRFAKGSGAAIDPGTSQEDARLLGKSFGAERDAASQIRESYDDRTIGIVNGDGHTPAFESLLRCLSHDRMTLVRRRLGYRFRVDRRSRTFRRASAFVVPDITAEDVKLHDSGSSVARE